MPSKTITLRIDTELLALVEAEARELNRARNWVICQALREAGLQGQRGQSRIKAAVARVADASLARTKDRARIGYTQ